MSEQASGRRQLSEEEALAIADAFIADVKAKDKSWDRTLTVIESANENRRKRRS